MKKFFLTLIVVFLAYYVAYNTSGASKKQELFSYNASPIFYKVLCYIRGSTDTTDVHSLNTRALQYVLQENYQLAIKDFVKILELDPAFNSAYFDLANVYLSSGDTLMAVITLNNCLQFADYKDKVYIELGNLYSKKGIKDSTIYYYTKATEVNSDNYNLYYQIATIYFADSTYDKALENVNLAISHSDSELEYRNLRRIIYIKQNQQLLADAEYQFIITNNPSYFGEHEQNAKNAYDKAEYQSAVEFYKLAILDKPNDRKLLEARAWSYHELKQYDSSLMDYKTVVELYPDNLSYFNLAYIYDILGEKRKSIDNYNISIKLKDDDYVSYNNRGYEFFKLNKYKEAEKDYNKSIELKSDYFLNNYNRGILYAKLQKHQKAVDDYLNAIKYKENSDVYYDLALSYDKLKKKEDAINSFNKFLKLADGSDSLRIKYATKKVESFEPKEK